MKFITVLFFSFICFYIFQPVVCADDNEILSNSLLNQLTQIITRVYKNLFEQIVDMPTQRVTQPVVNEKPDEKREEVIEKQDGYIFNIQGNKANIDLGRKDGVRSGMLLDVYREKDIYAPLKDRSFLVSLPLGKVVVTEIYENTATVYLSDFEAKTEKDQQNGKAEFSIKELDRVKRPEKKNSKDVNSQNNNENPKENSLKVEKNSSYARVLEVNDRKIHIDLVENIEVGDKIEVIGEKKEIKHPITGRTIQIPEKKAVIEIEEILENRAIAKIISEDRLSNFVVNDKIQVVKLD